MNARLIVAAGVLFAAAVPALAAKPLTDAEKLRAEAEHVCYDDVQKLCNDAIPVEDKIKACMKVHRAQLSPACGKIYDQGIGGG